MRRAGIAAINDSGHGGYIKHFGHWYGEWTSNGDGTLQNGEQSLTVGFEYSGRLSKASCQAEISLPAALLEGYALRFLKVNSIDKTSVGLSPLEVFA